MAKSKDKKKKLKERSLLGSAEKRLNTRESKEVKQPQASKVAAAGTGAAGPSESSEDI